MKVRKPRPARFLNVDLQIWSARDLRPLIRVLKKETIVLHAIEGFAAFEFLPQLRNAPATLNRFCELLEKLPPAARNSWESAKTRQMDVGIEGGAARKAGRFSIPASTLARVAKLKAERVFTVYSPDLSLYS